ncbi:hypothetical protein Clacol_001365 [Clathrus columnatus]|uniref:Sm domain-containing protein n=1 Tax=Clathrus columnatus TaxID=1419009 RepID=A0AAV5A5J0_9AGAM|nr:hypothetical protein Clacol_001365 [Clathrus columnatus]
MNIALEQTEEYVNGKVTNQYGDCFVRGNNVLYITAAETSCGRYRLCMLKFKFHLVCVDELGEEWLCLKCVDEGEEGALNGDEEKEEPGVSLVLNTKAKTQILHASNASVNVLQQPHRRVIVVDSKRVKPRAKPRQKQKQAKQQQQKLPDFAPTMPESSIRSGVGN